MFNSNPNMLWFCLEFQAWFIDEMIEYLPNQIDEILGAAK